MFIISLTFLLFVMTNAVNTKHLSRNNRNKRQQESHLCLVIKQRKREHLIKYNNQLGNSRHSQPYKPLYIPESKNCR